MISRFRDIPKQMISRFRGLFSIKGQYFRISRNLEITRNQFWDIPKSWNHLFLSFYHLVLSALKTDLTVSAQPSVHHLLTQYDRGNLCLTESTLVLVFTSQCNGLYICCSRYMFLLCWSWSLGITHSPLHHHHINHTVSK